jgi:hypothetical protein
MALRPRQAGALIPYPPSRSPFAGEEFIMNLVKSILDQLSGNALDSLSTIADSDAETTRTAATAAVPAILSALTGMAGSDTGARKLASALEGLDTGGLSNLAKMLGGDGGSLVQKGSQLLTSLIGESLVSNIASSIGKFAGLDPAATKKLIAAIAPTVIGLVGSQWKQQGGTVGGLSSLLADQKRNIVAAVPAGFSLTDIPGMSTADAALRVAGQASRRTADAANDATKTALMWALPLACLLLVALAIWWAFNRGRAAPNVAQNPARQGIVDHNAATAVTALKPTLPDLPAIPDVSVVTKDLTGIFTSATQTLGSIRDAASAQAALPKLTELNLKLDGIRDLFDKLPAAGQAALGQLVSKQFAPLQEQAAKILATPGIDDQTTSMLEGITSKLAGLNLAQVSKDATDIFATLTKTLNGLKDSASVGAAAPQLQEVSGKLDDLKRIQAAMSPGGQTMLAKLVTSARGSIEPLIASVLQALGVDAAEVKPKLDEILDKLTSLASPPAARDGQL